MQHDEFMSMLAREGFGEIAIVEREANGFLDSHAHPFEAKALILDGEILLRIGDAEQICKAGHTFHLAANQPHSERYGPEGVKYVVGRK
jgi:quercetin dioxygenase-like cupin family protein